MAKELLEGIDIANVKGVRLFSEDLDGLTVTLDIVAANVGLASWCQALRNRSRSLQALRLQQTLLVRDRLLLLPKSWLLLRLGRLTWL